MKIAISTAGASLDADTEPRFGRCPYFIIVDPETLEFEAVNNSAAMAAGGAGISAAQSIADKGVQAVLTGHCGPNAHQVLSAAGIQIITGVSGKVREAIEGYRLRKYKASDQADVQDHFGLGNAAGTGQGCGKGRGMGRNAGMPASAAPAPQPQRPEEELRELKAQSKSLIHQLAEIQRRIEELEKN